MVRSWNLQWQLSLTKKIDWWHHQADVMTELNISLVTKKMISSINSSCKELFNFGFELHIVSKECRDSSCIQRPDPILCNQLIKELEWSKHFWPKLFLVNFTSFVLASFHYVKFSWKKHNRNIFYMKIDH